MRGTCALSLFETLYKCIVDSAILTQRFTQKCMINQCMKSIDVLNRIFSIAWFGKAVHTHASPLMFFIQY
jgi:hypothetical protein